MPEIFIGQDLVSDDESKQQKVDNSSSKRNN